MTDACTTRVLGPDDIADMRSMLAVLGEAFGEPDTFSSNPPDDAYLSRLLASDTFVAVAALADDRVVGGLAGYVLPKFEQARSEFYIYDLAVDAAYRRRGVATALIRTLQKAVQPRGVYVVFVQADYGDDAAVALYTKLGVREDVMHFDLLPPGSGPGGA